MYPSNKNVEPVKSSSKIGKGWTICELDRARFQIECACCVTIVRDKLSPVSVASPVQIHKRNFPNTLPTSISFSCASGLQLGYLREGNMTREVIFGPIRLSAGYFMKKRDFHTDARILALLQAQPTAPIDL